MRVIDSASGPSCGVVAEQVPGGGFSVAAAESGAAGAAGAPAAAPGPTIGLSEITAAIPGLSVSAATAELGTRAAIASTSR